MNRIKSDQELISHKENTIKKIETYLHSLIVDQSIDNSSRIEEICYWLKQYIAYLDFEKTFNPRRNKKYERGEIIKVDFGFNIGNELKGRHYAIVVDKNNSINNGIVTVVPLTSIKPTTNIATLNRGSVFLGNEFFTTLSTKLHSLIDCLESEIKIYDTLTTNCNDPSASNEVKEESKKQLLSYKVQILKLRENVKLARKIKSEIDKMKQGSIALVSQIKTVSKIRIIDPRTTRDVLSNVKLSNESLDSIDNCIKELFTK